MANQPQTAAAPPNVSGQYDKKTTMTILIGVGVILLTVAIPLALVFWPDFERERLLEEGTQAPGQITHIEPTGNWVNNQPETRVTVRVMPEGIEPFEATATMIINPVYLPQFQPGKNVLVRYDPEDHSKIAIEETEETMRQ